MQFCRELFQSKFIVQGISRSPILYPLKIQKITRRNIPEPDELNPD